jgi:urease accessory protein
MQAADLVAWQLADSAFPSGSYTLSHGLEGYAQDRAIAAADVPALLNDLLLHAIGPADATALALAHQGASSGDWELVCSADERLHASKLTREPRQASLRIGRQLLDLCGEVFPSPPLTRLTELVAAGEAPGTQPIVVAVVAAGAGVDRSRAVAADLFAFCTSFAGAALRLRLADHRSAQTLIRGAAPAIEQATGAALRRRLDDIGGCAPLADAMSARHELAEAKLFAS